MPAHDRSPETSKQNDHSAVALRSSVATFESCGDLNGALEALTASGGAIDSDLPLLLKLGDLGFKLLKLGAAQDAYQRALLLSPRDVPIHFRLAATYRELGAFEISLRHWQTICELDPRFDEAHFSAGFQYSLNGWFDLAVKQFAFVSSSKDGFWLAEISNAKQQLAESLKFVDEHCRAEKTAGVELVKHLIRIGKVEQAESLMHSLPLAPSAMRRLRFLLDWRSHSLEAAVRQLTESASSHPLDVESAVTLADGLMRLNLPQEAETTLANIDTTNAAEHIQELAFRISYARGYRGFESAHELANAMARKRPRDPKPPQYALTLMLSEGKIETAHGVGRTVPNPSAIPGTIFQFWHGDTVPEDVLQVIETWSSKERHGPKLVLFSDKLAREFLKDHYEKSFSQAYANCHHAAMQSDFIRLCYLYKYGGVYVDVDEECLGEPKDILSYLRFSEFVAPLSTGVPRYFNNNLIASVPGHPIIEMALSEVVPQLQSGAKLSIWNTTGPALLTKSIVKYLTENRDSGRRVAAMSEDYLRSLCKPHYSLDYKSRAEGNWRLA